MVTCMYMNWFCLTLCEAVEWNTWFSDTWYQLYVREKKSICWSFWDAIAHWGQVMLIWVRKIIIIDSDNALSVPSHYLNQCWNIVNSALRNKNQWNVYRNSKVFIEENAFENAKWWPFCPGLNVLMWRQCSIEFTFIYISPTKYEHWFVLL